MSSFVLFSLSLILCAFQVFPSVFFVTAQAGTSLAKKPAHSAQHPLDTAPLHTRPPAFCTRLPTRPFAFLAQPWNQPLLRGALLQWRPVWVPGYSLLQGCHHFQDFPADRARKHALLKGKKKSPAHTDISSSHLTRVLYFSFNTSALLLFSLFPTKFGS